MGLGGSVLQEVLLVLNVFVMAQRLMLSMHYFYFFLIRFYFWIEVCRFLLKDILRIS